MISVLPAGAATASPEEIVKTTTESVLSRVSADQDALRADPRRLEALVDEMIVPYFDFRRMAQWVLGKYWREANPDAQARFVAEFRTMLIRTYATALLEYSHQKVNYYPNQIDPAANHGIVKTELAQPGGVPIPIDYRMHRKDGEWKVFDVAVDGVSLLTTYRSSFAAEIRKSGIEALIASLAARNNGPEPATTAQ
ncbi:MAG: phospholipid-binding protein MlaC [Gammaproteobacteria bacterium]